MLSVIMLSVVMLNVIMLSVVASFQSSKHSVYFIYFDLKKLRLTKIITERT
jgi:hypothetical protein